MQTPIVNIQLEILIPDKNIGWTLFSCTVLEVNLDRTALEAIDIMETSLETWKDWDIL